MCGRYFYGLNEKELSDIVEYTDDTYMYSPDRRDIFPTDMAPLIIATGKGITLTQKKWGFPGIDQKGSLINARAETVSAKKMFAGGITMRRAVIPASGFYEWNKRKKKNPDKIFYAKNSIWKNSQEQTAGGL